MAVGFISYKITADMKGFKKAMTDASKSLNDTAKEAKSTGGIFSSMTGGLKSIAKSAGDAVGSLVGLAARLTVFKAVNATFNQIGSSISSAMGRADTMQTFARAMERITGTSEEAKNVLQQVNDVVKGTPYGLDVAAKAVQGFANSNIAVKDSVRYVESWGDAVAAYGDGSSDTLQRVTFQLMQMAAKGKVNLGDLNSAMEAGIPVLQIYAKASGKSLDQVRDEISKATISTTDFFDTMDGAFRKGTDGFAGVAGSAKAAGDLWKGTFDNMKAATTRGVLSILDAIDAGLVSVGLPKMKQIIAEYGKILENGMKGMAPKVLAAFQGMAKVFNWFKSVWEAFSANVKWSDLMLKMYALESSFTAAWEKITGSVKGASGSIGTDLASLFNQIAPFILDFAKMLMDNIPRSIEFLTAVFKGFALGTGDTFAMLAPAVKSLLEIFIGLMQGIQDMLPKGQSLTDTVRQLTPVVLKAFIAFKAFSGVKGIFTGLIPTFTKVSEIIGVLKGTRLNWAGMTVGSKAVIVAVRGIKLAFTAMKFVVMGVFALIKGAIVAFVGVVGAPVAIVVGVVAALIAVFVLLYAKCEWFRNGVKAVWSAIVSAFSSAVKTVGGWLTAFGGWIASVWSSAVGWFKSAGSAIGSAMSSAANGCRRAGTAISNVWNSIVSAFKVSVEFVKNVVTVGFMLVFNIISGAIRLILSVIIGTLDTVRYLWQIGWTVVSDFFKGIWDGIVNFIKPILDSISNFFSSAWEGTSDTTVSVWTAISDFFIGVWNGIVEFCAPVLKAIGDTISATWEGIKTVTSAVWDAVVAFIKGVWNELSNVVSVTVSTISTAISTAWNWIKDVSAAVWDAVVTVLTTMWENMKRNVTTVFEIVKQVISASWEWIKAVTSAVWDAIVTILTTWWNNIKSNATTAFEAIKSVISGVWEGIKNVTTTVWEGIKNAIMTPINAAKNGVESAINAIKGFFSNLKLKFPDITPPRLPKLELTGKFSLNPPSVPRLSHTGWYATGGIATGASVVGIGEAGDEAIVPLSNKSRMRPFAAAVASMIRDDNKGNSSSSDGSGVTITGNTFVVRNDSDIRKIGQAIVQEADRKDLAKGKRSWGDD